MRAATVCCAAFALCASDAAAQERPTDRSEIPSCGNRSKLFTRSPIDVDRIFSIVPLGNVQPPEHTFPTRHLYFHIVREVPEDFSTPTVEVAVRAPGLLWVTQISSTENLTTGAADYGLRFAVCAEVSGYFLHLTTLSSRLANRLVEPMRCDEYTTGGEDWRQCTRELEVKFKAGRRLGTAGGGADRNAVDFGLTDYRADPLPFANPERWTDALSHAACPLDAIKKNVRRRLQRLLGYGDVVRTTPPICGAVEQDAEGTLAGVWFAEGTVATYPEDAHLAMIRDNIEPHLAVFSVGISMRGVGLEPGRYRFTPTNGGSVDLDFELATVGTALCYQVTEATSGEARVLLARLLDDDSMRLGVKERASCGSGPWSLPAGSPRFER